MNLFLGAPRIPRHGTRVSPPLLPSVWAWAWACVCACAIVASMPPLDATAAPTAPGAPIAQWFHGFGNRDRLGATIDTSLKALTDVQEEMLSSNGTLAGFFNGTRREYFVFTLTTIGLRGGYIRLSLAGREVANDPLSDGYFDYNELRFGFPLFTLIDGAIFVGPIPVQAKAGAVGEVAIGAKGNIFPGQSAEAKLRPRLKLKGVAEIKPTIGFIAAGIKGDLDFLTGELEMDFNAVRDPARAETSVTGGGVSRLRAFAGHLSGIVDVNTLTPAGKAQARYEYDFARSNGILLSQRILNLDTILNAGR